MLDLKYTKCKVHKSICEFLRQLFFYFKCWSFSLDLNNSNCTQDIDLRSSVSFLFRRLLEFWKTHYLRRGKDCSALEQVSCTLVWHYRPLSTTATRYLRDTIFCYHWNTVTWRLRASRHLLLYCLQALVGLIHNKFLAWQYFWSVILFFLSLSNSVPFLILILCFLAEFLYQFWSLEASCRYSPTRRCLEFNLSATLRVAVLPQRLVDKLIDR